MRASPMAIEESAGAALTDTRAVGVELCGVSKRFGSRRLFSNLSARAKAGRVLGVGGPNGSGKSTLVKVVAGLVTPDSGSVHVCISGNRLCPSVRRSHIGLVAPDIGLYASLTAAEHVEYYAELRGVPARSGEVAVALERVGLSGKRRTPVGAYSSGMRQRLRYACAIIHRPAVLLLDEPFMALDGEGVHLVEALVDRQRTHGVCIIAGNSASELALADDVVMLGADDPAILAAVPGSRS
ncbi:MAG: ABC transporter ATP-binding protein [Armatimonadetes bacterium]|nr:ABC transporter ATP-binding protein [Armatimonadota bacterium]